MLNVCVCMCVCVCECAVLDIYRFFSDSLKPPVHLWFKRMHFARSNLVEICVTNLHTNKVDPF